MDEDAGALDDDLIYEDDEWEAQIPVSELSTESLQRLTLALLDEICVRQDKPLGEVLDEMREALDLLSDD